MTRSSAFSATNLAAPAPADRRRRRCGAVRPDRLAYYVWQLPPACPCPPGPATHSWPASAVECWSRLGRQDRDSCRILKILASRQVSLLQQSSAPARRRAGSEGLQRTHCTSPAVSPGQLSLVAGVSGPHSERLGHGCCRCQRQQRKPIAGCGRSWCARRCVRFSSRAAAPGIPCRTWCAIRLAAAALAALAEERKSASASSLQAKCTAAGAGWGSRSRPTSAVLRRRG